MSTEKDVAMMFFLPKGKIRGGTADRQYRERGAFNVSSFELRADNHTNIGSAAAAHGGKVHFERLVVRKHLDLSTPGLFRELCAGTKLAEAHLHVLAHDRSGTHSAVFQIVLRHVTVAEVRIVLEETGDWPMEEVSLDYGSIHMVYEDGHAEHCAWNRVKGEAAD